MTKYLSLLPMLLALTVPVHASAACGDGVIDSGEACDDGNTVQFDACSNTCKSAPGQPCLIDTDCQVGTCPYGYCNGCYDTAAPGGIDYNCTGGGPACDVSGSVPLCVGCLANPDCPIGSVCDLLSHACNMSMGGTDAGVDAGTGPDSGVDAGATLDAGSDAGTDAGLRDSGVDASADASSPGRGGGASGGACSVDRAPARGHVPGAFMAFSAILVFVRRKRRLRGAPRVSVVDERC